MAKRVRYETKNKFESIDSSEGSDDNYNLNQLEDSSDPEVAIEALNYQSRRKPKCFSKNAQMARQNRLKKKIHLAKLEKKVEILKKEKNDLNNIIHVQSNKLSELKKEVRYLKGVLVNSSDIRTLVRNIHESTGMPVSSSLSNRLKVCTNGTIKDEFEDSLINKDSYLSESNPILDFNTDLDSYMNTEDFSLNFEDAQQISYSLEEHNYTNKLSDNEDYGICLHVCKNKVSLEFCSKCEENAKRSSA